MSTAEPAVPARVKKPPCGFPGYQDPEDTTRLQYIDFNRFQGGEVRNGSTCFHRKRKECAEYFGYVELAARSKRDAPDAPARCKVVATEPCPPIVQRTDALWGTRCTRSQSRVHAHGLYARVYFPPRRAQTLRDFRYVARA